jgi:hypothetical protein
MKWSVSSSGISRCSGGLRRWPVVLICLFASIVCAHAQLALNLEIKRRMFLPDEPVIATVTIVNNTGHDIMLADTAEGGPWFSFQISTNEQRTVPPRVPNYELQPLAIKAGESVKRSVNLTDLFPISDFGPYHVVASVYLPSLAKFFSSRRDSFEVTEGRQVWKQTVGMPGTPENLNLYRTFTLMTLEQDRGKMLYARVVGDDDGVVYGCYPLGRILDGFPPDVKLDAGNNLNVLQSVGQKEYLFSRVAADGHFIGQTNYTSAKGQPYLRKLENGTLQLVGAIRQQSAQAAPEHIPKLSERPSNLPK